MANKTLKHLLNRIDCAPTVPDSAASMNGWNLAHLAQRRRSAGSSLRSSVEGSAVGTSDTAMAPVSRLAMVSARCSAGCPLLTVPWPVLTPVDGITSSTGAGVGVGV